MAHGSHMTPMSRRTVLARIAVLCALTGVPLGRAQAGIADDFAALLAPAQLQQFQAWRTSKRVHEAKLDAYWAAIETKKAERRKKRAAHIDLTADDYVQGFPPTYEGPHLPPDLLRAWNRYVAEQEAKLPPPIVQPPKEIPSLDDFLAASKAVYGFTPERVSERAFKERYAEEAMALGLSKAQVVRVYALETSGQGTADMQSGVHPISKRGKPISTALGYAQLLDANSVSELAKHGRLFIARLEQMAQRSDIPRERALQLRAKAAVLARMVADARSVPDDWRQHQAYAKTANGQGIHAINLDGDIGPMLQAVKLLGLKDYAAKEGIMQLTGAQLELLNLTGPGTGIQILLYPAAQAAPTPNFFTRTAYSVNKMANNLTGAGLLGELDRRMDADIGKPGAAEFLAAFDTITQAPLPWR